MEKNVLLRIRNDENELGGRKRSDRREKEEKKTRKKTRKKSSTLPRCASCGVGIMAGLAQRGVVPIFRTLGGLANRKDKKKAKKESLRHRKR